MRQEKSRKYATQFMNYNQADSYYIEVYTNIKRVIKVEAITEQEAIRKALKREERRKTRNCYTFVDCDYNVVEEKDYEAYRQTNQEIRRGRS
jgi:hypothetical protein|tara:strand:+ start:759 stop:1034 length:276 start_codon:yes stop_codon:yes gene_type:complete